MAGLLTGPTMLAVIQLIGLALFLVATYYLLNGWYVVLILGFALVVTAERARS